MRKFKQRTAMTPVDWLSTARVDRVRELLETTMLSIDMIAVECGLGSATNLRHHFRRKLGISPTEYRKRFGEQFAQAAYTRSARTSLPWPSQVAKYLAECTRRLALIAHLELLPFSYTCTRVI